MYCIWLCDFASAKTKLDSSAFKMITYATYSVYWKFDKLKFDNILNFFYWYACKLNFNVCYNSKFKFACQLVGKKSIQQASAEQKNSHDECTNKKWNVEGKLWEHCKFKTCRLEFVHKNWQTTVVNRCEMIVVSSCSLTRSRWWRIDIIDWLIGLLNQNWNCITIITNEWSNQNWISRHIVESCWTCTKRLSLTNW